MIFKVSLIFAKINLRENWHTQVNTSSSFLQSLVFDNENRLYLVRNKIVRKVKS